ncbi:MAG: NAD(P)/FAD-dependent oxidoreductase [Chloroflexi bacterium]|nr:NAD(P)/FAD-dependent oxidoreductase [Chloroflexota bacterium]
MSEVYDVAVVGAGVVGCLIARALSRYQLKILLLDKEADVCCGASKANTAIVHAGYDPKPGTQKAILNVGGNAMYDQLCTELGVHFLRCGTYVVAFSDDDVQTLDDLLKRGQRNGVPGLRIISREEMIRAEPHINPEVRAALYTPSGGIVDPFGLTIAAAENAVANGVEVRLETEVTGLLRHEGRVKGVVAGTQSFRSHFVVNAAGVYADEIMRMAGLDGFTIRPRRGEYFVFDREMSPVRSVLFPCPTPVSKGIVVTTTTHGNTMVGPNAQDIESKEDTRVTAEGLDEVLHGAQRLVPSLDPRAVIRVFAGLRAVGSTGDFLIEAAREAPGLINVAGIESPGLSAAPAIAERVVEILREEGLALYPKSDYNPIRVPPPDFSELSHRERAALIATDPRYGRIVCRCETVTEGEIVAAIHGLVPARNYDAIKRRTRCGSGRCQGGFDTPRVLEILARELGCPATKVTLNGPGSELVVRGTKEVDH